MSKQYIFQEFLLRCPYQEIKIENYLYSGDSILFGYKEDAYNLFDYMDGISRRSITLTELDRIVDTEKDFVRFIGKISRIDELILIDDRPIFQNIILKTYSQNTIKAFLYRINNAGTRCLISLNQQGDSEQNLQFSRNTPEDSI